MTDPNERQVGGNHYRQGSMQHWDLMAQLGLDWFTANATKYLSRWALRNGAQDLEKALHYLQKALSLGMEQPRLDVSRKDARDRTQEFVNGLCDEIPQWSRDMIMQIVLAQGRDLQRIADELRQWVETLTRE